MNSCTVFSLLIALALLCAGSEAAEKTQIRVLHAPLAVEPSGSGGLYPSHRPPLVRSFLLKLPPESVTPQGWLRRQLELEADGLAGRLPEVSPFLRFENNGWADPRGKDGWEELPYWLKGYGDLGYVLHDRKIIAGARKWIDAILAGQEESGWFGPRGLKTSLNGKPDMWPHMPVLNALQSFYEYSGDPRVLPFMTRYFHWQNSLPAEDFGAGYWPKLRFGDNLESIYWLYNRTGDAELLVLARKMHEHMADWTSDLPDRHNVNLSQGFREPAEYWLQSHEPRHRDAAERNYRKLMQLYGQFPGGGFAGDENCRSGYRDPHQGFETCGIVEFMHSFELLARITGNPDWADRCEELAFNSLPAALTPDGKALHYLTAANSVLLDAANHAPGIQNRGTMLSFSPGTVYRCCQHNHGMGWPYFTEELWQATTDQGPCANLYAPSEVHAKVGDGTPVQVSETTEYPFGESIELKVTTPHPTRFPLYLRLPGWTNGASLRVNGKAVPVTAAPRDYLAVDRRWQTGDTVTLALPMRVETYTWKANRNAASVRRGPLWFSLKIDEKWSRSGGSDTWPETEVRAGSPWNYGLALDNAKPAASLELIRKPGAFPEQPFTPAAAPLEIRAPARRIPGWTLDRNGLAGVLHESPIHSDEPLETITLIPMGAARLRITSFPVLGSGPDAHGWVASDVTASASHTWQGDTTDALNDGIEPANSGGQGIPRFTWWDHRGTAEWVQYDFTRPRTLSAISVYWFDDTGVGACRVPLRWKLLYRIGSDLGGSDWKEVEQPSGYGVERDRYNLVTFRPITSTAVRIEVQLQPQFSSGILEWKLE